MSIREVIRSVYPILQRKANPFSWRKVPFFSTKYLFKFDFALVAKRKVGKSMKTKEWKTYYVRSVFDSLQIDFNVM